MDSLKLQKEQRIYVNRSLNMASIKSVGFDMDHTLAPYHRENFETLAFKKTLEKFITAGYPEELATIKFDPNFVMRGLLVDKDRGNLLKLDTHKYVKTAFHGHKKLSKQERHQLYNSESIKPEEFLSVDTFFALSEVQLFTEIVDYMSRHPGVIHKSYKEIYADLRTFIDLSHADGSIKDEVARNPEKYIINDRHLTATLLRLVEAGKSLFLLTNSQYDYTDFVMSHLLKNSHANYPNWHDFFDYIIVGASKPSFFTGDQPFHEVIPESGLLKHQVTKFEKHHIYHSGNAKLFQKLTQQKGDEILYLGDHIYTDIIRSKGLFNWRTLLIVEEMSSELPKIEKLEDLTSEINNMLYQLELEDEKAQIMRSRIDITRKQVARAEAAGDRKKLASLQKNLTDLTEKLMTKEIEIIQIQENVKNKISEREKSFHPIWGELMRCGWEKSRFAKQVEDYACLYTGRVSNLRFYSSFKKFTSPRDMMPHDL